ncbi:MAG TPA: hypothetical protein VF940_15000 [Streptosporangiaceae bacterium]
MTGQHAPDDRQLGNGQMEAAADAGPSGDDPLAAPRAWLASFWALMLRRFRDYAHGSGDSAGNRERKGTTDDIGR